MELYNNINPQEIKKILQDLDLLTLIKILNCVSEELLFRTKLKDV